MSTFSVLVCSILLISLSPINGQLSASDPSIYDGPCNFPQILAVNANILTIFNPLIPYYVPLANKVFRRTQYSILNNQNATMQTQLDSLDPRVHFFGFNALTLAADLEITFGGGYTEWYAYRCLPSSLVPVPGTNNPFAPLLNLTCTVPGGSQNVEPSSRVGAIVFSIIWSDPDSSAFTCWGCMNGRQIFHIMSTRPTLTEAQLTANEALLTPLGFNISNFENMTYV